MMRLEKAQHTAGFADSAAGRVPRPSHPRRSVCVCCSETGLLVLTRTLNESVLIGDNVEIKLVEIRGNDVRLGISEPTTVPQNREVLLALSDSISIGDNIEVMVVEIRGNNVRLGITAPQEVDIRREETRQ